MNQVNDTSQKQITNFVEKNKNNPKKNQPLASMEDKINEIFNRISKLDILEGLAHDVANFKTQLENVHSTVMQSVSEKLQENNEHWEAQRRSLDKRIERLEHKEEMNERRDRQKNITVSGVDFDVANPQTIIDEIFQEKLEINVTTTNVKTISTKGNRKIAIVRLSSLDDKKEVMRNKKKLAGTKISITPDYTKQESMERKKLLSHAANFKKEGKRVIVTHNKLIVDEVSMGLNKAGELRELREFNREVATQLSQKSSSSPLHQ